MSPSNSLGLGIVIGPKVVPNTSTKLTFSRRRRLCFSA